MSEKLSNHLPAHVSLGFVLLGASFSRGLLRMAENLGPARVVKLLSKHRHDRFSRYAFLHLVSLVRHCCLLQFEKECALDYIYHLPPSRNFQRHSTAMAFHFAATTEELCQDADTGNEHLHRMKTLILPDIQQLELSGKSLDDIKALDPHIRDFGPSDTKVMLRSCNGQVCNIGCPKGYVTDNFIISSCGTAPPRRPKEAHCLGEFNSQNEEDRKRHIKRIPRWLQSGSGPLVAMGPKCPDCGSKWIAA